MQHERDAFVLGVVPRPRKLLAPARVNVAAMDLRWGVPDELSLSDKLEPSRPSRWEERVSHQDPAPLA